MIGKLAFPLAFHLTFSLHVEELGILPFSCIVELALALGLGRGMHSVRTIPGKVVAIANETFDITRTALLTETTISTKSCGGPLSFCP